MTLSRATATARDAFTASRRSLFYPKTDLQIDDEVLRSLREPDTQVTNEQAKAVCKKALGKEPVKVEPLTQRGTFHSLRRCEFESQDSVILRASTNRLPTPDYLLELDPWLMPLLKARGIPVPRVYAVDLSREVVPFDYELLAEVKGETLTKFDEDQSKLPGLLSALGQMSAKIHAERASGFGWLDVEGSEPRGIFDTWREYIWLNLSQHIASCQDIGAIDSRESQQVKTLFRELAGVVDNCESRLLHGDLGNHNVFTDGTNITGIIDWEDSLAGDPVFDMAFWGTFHPEDRLAHFLAGYEQVSTLPSDFSLRYWLYSLRISLSKTVHRHRFGYIDRPGRKPASLRIQAALAHLKQLVSA